MENPTQKLRSDELHRPIQVQVWELWKLAMPKDRSILTDREPIQLCHEGEAFAQECLAQSRSQQEYNPKDQNILHLQNRHFGPYTDKP